MHTKCFSITQNRLENVGKARRRDTRLCGCFYFCGIKLDGGTRIEWIALTKIVGDKLHQLIIALVGYNRTLSLRPRTRQALKQSLHRHLKINRHPMAVHQIHIVAETWRAAATGYHDVLKLAHLEKHPPLKLTETRLTVLRKNLLHSLVVTVFNICVKIGKLAFKHLRQHPSRVDLPEPMYPIRKIGFIMMRSYHYFQECTKKESLKRNSFIDFERKTRLKLATLSLEG